MCSYVVLHVCVVCLLQITAFHKATQEGSIPHQSTQQSSVQHQPTVQYAIPNKKAAKNQNKGVSIFKSGMASLWQVQTWFFEIVCICKVDIMCMCVLQGY